MSLRLMRVHLMSLRLMTSHHDFHDISSEFTVS